MNRKLKTEFDSCSRKVSYEYVTICRTQYHRQLINMKTLQREENIGKHQVTSGTVSHVKKKKAEMMDAKTLQRTCKQASGCEWKNGSCQEGSRDDEC